jgi:hypothetical protein
VDKAALEYGSRDWSSIPSADVKFSSSFFPVIILFKHAKKIRWKRMLEPDIWSSKTETR